jgi:hypothetical protein
MADPITDIQTLLKRMQDQGARERELTDILGSIKQALVDAVQMLEQGKGGAPGEDHSAQLAQALTALKLPAPQVNVSPQMVTPKGASWSIKATRTGTGFDMTVTKL